VFYSQDGQSIERNTPLPHRVKKDSIMGIGRTMTSFGQTEKGAVIGQTVTDPIKERTFDAIRKNVLDVQDDQQAGSQPREQFFLR